MHTLIPNLTYEAGRPLYIQIYDFLKKEIICGRLLAGEKLPSLRIMAATLKLSITTVELAYNQLAVEGYIFSREKSGYFIGNAGKIVNQPPIYKTPELHPLVPHSLKKKSESYIDTALFDFVKWKKCLNQVINEFPDILAREAAPEGELALREQIAHYLYRSRGVLCSPDQIIIAAGTQQIVNIISGFFTYMNIYTIACENPGYLIGLNSLNKNNFRILPISLKKNGISLTEIEQHQPEVICVSPSNQFPSGIVMPAAKRYALLRYAHEKDCIIIEDDYASELRYFGRPVPPVKSLDNSASVLYLGSFSSVMFPSSKISYMVLPQKLMPYYSQVLKNYPQTCSKTEQLALSLYMEKGLFQIQIKKLRKLYAQKIHSVITSFKETFGDAVIIKGNDSGLNMLLEVQTAKDSETLCASAALAGLNMVPYNDFFAIKKDEDSHILIFYYSLIPLEKIPDAISILRTYWL